MKETLVDIVNVIRPKKSRSRASRRNTSHPQQNSSTGSSNLSEEQQEDNRRSQCYYNQQWSTEQERTFEEIVSKYGSDFSLLLNSFPQRSRKQIMKKYNKMFDNKTEAKNSVKEIKLKKKNIFQAEILEIQSSCSTETNKQISNRPI